MTGLRRSSGNYAVGYGKTPRNTRFKPGNSGNPKGRPRKAIGELPFESILDRTMDINDHGQARSVTVEEALLLKISQNGLAGDVAAAHAILEGYAAARLARGDDEEPLPNIRLIGIFPDNVDRDLVDLGMASKMDRYRDTAYMLLEPWLVQAALDRAEHCEFSQEDQAAIVKATRKPWKVKWPDGWSPP